MRSLIAAWRASPLYFGPTCSGLLRLSGDNRSVSGTIDRLERALIEEGARDVQRDDATITFERFRWKLRFGPSYDAIRKGVIRVHQEGTGIVVTYEIEFRHLVEVMIMPPIIIASAVGTDVLPIAPAVLFAVFVTFAAAVTPFRHGKRQIVKLISEALASPRALSDRLEAFR